MKLVVGLGNPGSEYAATRHNAGFWWVDALARQHRVSLRQEPRFHGALARLAGVESDIWLLQPSTFMNASGRAVAAVARFYKIAPEEVLVVHDELDLPPGTARLKKGGGVGGHNGLKDIAAQLGTPDFWRLRLGIGHPGDRDEVVNYVLHPPRPEEAQAMGEALRRSLEVWPLIARGAVEAAMLKLHTKKPVNGES